MNTPEDAGTHLVLRLLDKTNEELDGNSHRETGLDSDPSCN